MLNHQVSFRSKIVLPPPPPDFRDTGRPFDYSTPFPFYAKTRPPFERPTEEAVLGVLNAPAQHAPFGAVVWQPIRTCPVCGAQFETSKQTARRVYCSLACRNARRWATQPSVGKLRKSLVTVTSETKQATYKNKHGQVATMNTANIGGNRTTEAKPEPATTARRRYPRKTPGAVVRGPRSEQLARIAVCLAIAIGWQKPDARRRKIIADLRQRALTLALAPAV